MFYRGRHTITPTLQRSPRNFGLRRFLFLKPSQKTNIILNCTCASILDKSLLISFCLSVRPSLRLYRKLPNGFPLNSIMDNFTKIIESLSFSLDSKIVIKRHVHAKNHTNFFLYLESNLLNFKTPL